MNAPVRLKTTLLTLLVTAAAGSYVILDIGALTGNRSAISSPQTSLFPAGATPYDVNLPECPPRDTVPIPRPQSFTVPQAMPGIGSPTEQEKTAPTSSPEERERCTDGTEMRGTSTR